jgi:iron complex transport system ATP-binding protein
VQILEIITRLNREQGRTVVVVSHDLNLASIYCDRLVLLDKGRVVADGTPDEVLSSEILQETYQVKMTVSKGPDGRPFVVPERKT